MSADDGETDNSPPVVPEIACSPRVGRQVEPKVELQVEPISVHATARASVNPKVVVGKSDPRWRSPSGFSIPFEASPKHIGAVLVLLAFLYLIFFGFGGETSARLPLYGEIQGAGECSGLIAFRPGPEAKAPAAIAEIFKGRYFFTKLNGPLPGSYEVVIELSKLPSNTQRQATTTAEGQRPATAAAPDPFSAAPPAAQMTAPATVSAESDLKLDFQFVPNS